MTHTGVILSCDDGSELFFFPPVQPRAKWVTDFYYCSGLDEAWKAGSCRRCGNWLTDGTAGRETCEVGGLTLRWGGCVSTALPFQL